MVDSQQMPTLSVTNGYTQNLPGLGVLQRFDGLSEKRITKCVRNALREKFGHPAVTVSCSAEFDGARWIGACSVDGEPFHYKITP